MPLLIIGYKSKIPAFPAKAEEKPMVFQLFQPNSEKGSFPAIPSVPGGVDTLLINIIFPRQKNQNEEPKFGLGSSLQHWSGNGMELHNKIESQKL